MIDENHCTSREALLIWNYQGKPRSVDTFLAMKETRKEFKQAFRLCEKNEARIERETFINLYYISDNKLLF